MCSIFGQSQGEPTKADCVHDDRVQRGDRATVRIWLNDVTEHRANEGKVCLCAVKDVCSNHIVGYSMDARMKSSLAVPRLRMAVHQRAPTRTIVHSDRGSRFMSKKFVRLQRSHGLKGSMERVGLCGGNAANGILLRRAAEQPRQPAPGLPGPDPAHRTADKDDNDNADSAV